MTSVTKEFKFEAAHRLPNHPGACRHLHGHSYVVQVSVCLEGDVLNDQGMVIDFKELKFDMERVIGEWDHALLLYEYDALIDSLRAIDPDGKMMRIIEFSHIPTAENMARYIAGALQHVLSRPVYVHNVKVWETTTSFAEWDIKHLLSGDE